MKVTKYIKATDVAKMARAALKEAFPGQKFSVRTGGGQTLDIEWVDGPARKTVDAVTHRFAGEGFDGMQDMRYSLDNGIDPETGEAVQYLTSFVFTRHEMSAETRRALTEELATAISEEQGTPVQRVLESNNWWPAPQIYYQDVNRGPWEQSLYVMVRNLFEARCEQAQQ